jgi:cell division protein FtsB
MATTRRSRSTTARDRAGPHLRKPRIVLLGAACLSAAILAAWFPASALLQQRSNLTGANAQLRQLHSEDAALAQERKNLSSAAEISRIAREQYQLVSPGQQAFEVLPPAGTPGGSIRVPGGQSTALSPTSAVNPGGSTTSPGAPSQRSAAAQSSLLTRMLRALEFWH